MGKFTREYIIKYLKDSLSDGERKKFLYKMYLDEDLEKEVDKIAMEIGLFSTPFQKDINKKKNFFFQQKDKKKKDKKKKDKKKKDKKKKDKKKKDKEKKDKERKLGLIEKEWNNLKETIKEREDKVQRENKLRLLKFMLSELLQKRKIKEIAAFLAYVLRDDSNSKFMIRNYLINITNDLSMKEVSLEMDSINKTLIRDSLFRIDLYRIILNLNEKELKVSFYKDLLFKRITEEDIISYTPNKTPPLPPAPHKPSK